MLCVHIYVYTYTYNLEYNQIGSSYYLKKNMIMLGMIKEERFEFEPITLLVIFFKIFKSRRFIKKISCN